MPLHGASRTYDIVTTNFCAESVTDQRRWWYVYLQRIVSLVKPGGKFLASALKGASSYSVGERVFPAVDITEPDLASALGSVGCDLDSIVIESVVADRPTRHYQGLMFASARKGRTRHSDESVSDDDRVEYPQPDTSALMSERRLLESGARV